MATPNTNPTPTSVYLYYDEHGALIYVGITKTGIVRNRQHNADKEWWPWVSDQKIEHYPSRAEAEQRERQLIFKYRPPFNRQHNFQHEELRAAYRAARASGAFSAAVLNHMLPIEQRRFRVSVREASWHTGEIMLSVAAETSPAAARLKYSENVGVFEMVDGMRRKKIGRLSAVIVIGATAFIKLEIDRGYQFDEVELWLKAERNQPPYTYVVKQIAAFVGENSLDIAS
jgi:GIY-YIG catalytic domain-containing protein